MKNQGLELVLARYRKQYLFHQHHLAPASVVVSNIAQDEDTVEKTAELQIPSEDTESSSSSSSSIVMSSIPKPSEILSDNPVRAMMYRRARGIKADGAVAGPSYQLDNDIDRAIAERDNDLSMSEADVILHAPMEHEAMSVDENDERRAARQFDIWFQHLMESDSGYSTHDSLLLNQD
ncbi:uncharacterized protein LOC107269653 isoform X2 [Cephus cinctus]|uniref:Uncharacterized protein LOC107269653 isoform X2 n=1 Tax=Cephus cinctus TaxID=211228 RepID=A0AAJ7RLF4_CEPCN|nr:uncharacterized protein LOC107269653 isoform X2 [Cephus cinctus]